MDEAKRDKLEAMDELSLIGRAARGGHDAFRLIVLAYEARLLAYLTQMLGDAETARDVAQETFLAAYRALPRWQPPASHNSPGSRASGAGNAEMAHPLSPWLYRIATNRALSLLRGRPATPRLDAGAGPPEPATPLDERMAARDLLRGALRQLSEEDAACLVLHFVAGERYAEIAARLGLSNEAVRKRVSRALVALRAAYRALDVEVLA